MTQSLPAFRLRPLACLGLWYACSGLAATDPDDALFFGELPIVASVSRLPQRLADAPGAVTVIDQEMIRASGMRTVEDLLRLVPGFQVTSHSQSPAVVSYHGLSGTGLAGDEYTPRVQVLIDGRSMYSPLFKSGVNWNLLPVALENIERVEVIRGSNTVSYGSNAALGVINIITQDPSLTTGWLVSANHGNNDIRDQTVRWGGKVGEARVRVTAHQVGDDGFQLGFYSNKWMTNPDSRRSRVFDVRADVPLNNQDELQLTTSFADDVSQFGRPNNDPKYPLWYQNQSSASLSAKWRRVYDAEREMSLRYSYTEDRSGGSYVEGGTFDLVSGLTATASTPVDAWGVSRVHELEWLYQTPLSSEVRASLGASARSIQLASLAQFATPDRHNRTHYRVFSNAEYRPSESWVLNAGASVEHDTLTGTALDPRFSASYHLTPEHTARFIVSRAHRTPNLYEYSGEIRRYGTNAATPGVVYKNVAYFGQGVEPEQVDTVELGYLAELRRVRASFDARAFIERIPNRIQVVPMALPASNPDDQDSLAGRATGYPYGRADGAANIERVFIRGYEYQLKWQPFDSTRITYGNALICIDANLTNPALVMDSSDNIPKIVEQTRQSAPVRSQQAMVVQDLPYNMQASVMYYDSGPVQWRRTAPLSVYNERWDWRLAKRFNLGGSRAEVAYTAQMVNQSVHGRMAYRLMDSLHWLSMKVEF